eukprot:scaffold58689_cov63-Phaeocystis_antarctica.AAC.4
MHHPSLRPSASQVVLSGPREAVTQTAAAIEELTREELPLEVQQALSRMLDEEKLVSVPANRVGRVIGSRGAALRVETGAEIDLQKDNATGAATVAIRGSAEAMAAAKLAIERIIEAGP